MIKLNHIQKVIKNKKIIDDVNLNINKHEIIGLIGENGAGKTTLIKLISGLLRPSKGIIEKEPDIKLSVLLDDGGLFPDLTAYENIKLKAIRLGINQDEISYVMNLLKINKYGNKKVKNFSLGMKRRTAIALCLLDHPHIILLDEPTNGLDPQGISDMRYIIDSIYKHTDTTILVSSHILDQLAKVCTQYIFMKEGKIIENIKKEEFDSRIQNKLMIKVPNHQIEDLKRVMKEHYSEIAVFVEENNAEENNVLTYYADPSLNTKIIYTLIEKNISVIEIYNEKNDLEEYFLNLDKE